MNLLKRLWNGWKRFGKKVGDFQARVLLTIFYFVILAPFGLGMRAADPLGLRKAGEPAWRKLERRLEERRTKGLLSDFEDYTVDDSDADNESAARKSRRAVSRRR